MSPYIILVFLIPSIIFLIVGWYIGKTGYVEVLKHYDEKKEYDKKGFSKFIRNVMMSIGCSTMVLIALALILNHVMKVTYFSQYFLVVYVIMIIIYLILLRISPKKYEIK